MHRLLGAGAVLALSLTSSPVLAQPSSTPRAGLAALETAVAELQTTVAALQATVDAQQGEIASLQTTVAAQETHLSTLQGTVDWIDTRVALAQGEVDWINESAAMQLNQYLEVTRDEYLNLPLVRFSGVNVQVVNGNGPLDFPELTLPPVNGLGNLIVGYNENVPFLGQDAPPWLDRSGSHNLVVGVLHGYTSAGALVAGMANSVQGAYSFVSGGSGNLASGNRASISGGSGNTAGGISSSISGAVRVNDFETVAGRIY